MTINSQTKLSELQADQLIKLSDSLKRVCQDDFLETFGYQMDESAKDEMLSYARFSVLQSVKQNFTIQNLIDIFLSCGEKERQNKLASKFVKEIKKMFIKAI